MLFKCKASRNTPKKSTSWELMLTNSSGDLSGSNLLAELEQMRDWYRDHNLRNTSQFTTAQLSESRIAENDSIDNDYSSNANVSHCCVIATHPKFHQVENSADCDGVQAMQHAPMNILSETWVMYRTDVKSNLIGSIQYCLVIYYSLQNSAIIPVSHFCYTILIRFFPPLPHL